MLASLPSMGDRADDRIPIPFSPGLYFLVAHQGCFSLGVRQIKGLGLEFLATWQWASRKNQFSEVPAMRFDAASRKQSGTLSKNYVTHVTVTIVGLSRTCTWHEPNVRLRRGGIARTPLRPSSRIEPWSTLVSIFPGKCGSTKQSSTRRRRTRTRSRRFNDEDRILS